MAHRAWQSLAEYPGAFGHHLPSPGRQLRAHLHREVLVGVAVRDTTNRDGITLEFTAGAWEQFTRRLRG
jgi:Domain of unknown function (DUF397)